jgi:ABC-2 type transport system ATP-binding protein
MDNSKKKAEYAIVVDNLLKQYGKLTAVNKISFKIPFGVIFAFLGPNGAGKTTTVEMLECLRKPSGGSAYILGLDIYKDQNKIRKRIGVLPQEFNTFDRLTVRENLQYYAALYDRTKDIDNLISDIDLVDKAHTQYKDLSGGLKQRVGVAIALVNDPEVVFLDEPTEGLDPKSRRGVWDVIKSLRDQGKTVFLTTHYMEEAEVLADTVAIILDGTIKAMDSPTNLINHFSSRGTLVVRGGGSHAFEAVKAKWNTSKLENGNVVVPLTEKSDLKEIIELLDHKNIPFDELELKRSTLEDVFLNITEKELEAQI